MAKTGRCICGKVTFEANDPASAVGACHCSTCRRWGGGPFMELDCGTEIAFDGEQHIRVYDSSDWAERGFCAACGTHLFYRLKGNGAHMVPVGTFDDDAGVKFETQVFVDEKPKYYEFANKTQMLTGAELFALHAAED